MRTRTLCVYSRYAWLAAGLFFISFANANAVPAAAWLGPVFFMGFTRRAESRGEIALAAAGLCAAQTVSLLGAFANDFIHPVMRMMYCCGYALFMYLPPFLIDRFFHARRGGLAGSLVFPASVVCLEYVCSLLTPFSTFGLLAYTQYGNLPLMQLVSVTGIWGLAFVVAWAAPVANELWEHRCDLSAAQGPAMAFALVLVAALMYGGLRVNRDLAGPVVRAAVSSLSYNSRGHFAAVIRGGKAPDVAAGIAAFDSFIDSVPDRGVDLALWHEYALIVNEANVRALLEHAAKRIRKRGLYCAVPLGVVKAVNGRARMINTVYFYGPDGELLARYVKSFTTPWEISEGGEKRVPVVKTGFGRAALAICFDMDFPFLIRQAGRAGAGVMLAPSSDWRGIVPFHSRMAVFRAIENGFSLLRPAGPAGLSIATDPMGRVAALLDNADSKDRLLIAAVPARGVFTLYSVIGDAFAWLCLAFIGWRCVALFVKRDKEKTHQ